MPGLPERPRAPNARARRVFRGLGRRRHRRHGARTAQPIRPPGAARHADGPARVGPCRVHATAHGQSDGRSTAKGASRRRNTSARATARAATGAKTAPVPSGDDRKLPDVGDAPPVHGVGIEYFRAGEGRGSELERRAHLGELAESLGPRPRAPPPGTTATTAMEPADAPAVRNCTANDTVTRSALTKQHHDRPRPGNRAERHDNFLRRPIYFVI